MYKDRLVCMTDATISSSGVHKWRGVVVQMVLKISFSTVHNTLPTVSVSSGIIMM